MYTSDGRNNFLVLLNLQSLFAGPSLKVKKRTSPQAHHPPPPLFPQFTYGPINK